MVLTSSTNIASTVWNAHCLASPQTCSIRASGAGARESAFEHRKSVTQHCRHITLWAMKSGFSEVGCRPKARGGWPCAEITSMAWCRATSGGGSRLGLSGWKTWRGGPWGHEHGIRPALFCSSCINCLSRLSMQAGFINQSIERNVVCAILVDPSRNRCFWMMRRIEMNP